MKNTAFCYEARYSLAEMRYIFGETCYLYLQSRKWERKFPHRRWCISNTLRGATSHVTLLSDNVLFRLHEKQYTVSRTSLRNYRRRLLKFTECLYVRWHKDNSHSNVTIMAPTCLQTCIHTYYRDCRHTRQLSRRVCTAGSQLLLAHSVLVLRCVRDKN
jgi:hypothetical protein